MDVLDVAAQMTLDEFSVFSAVVPPLEYGHKAFAEDDAALRAPNVTLLTKRVNVISWWVATEVCHMQATKKKRLKKK